MNFNKILTKLSVAFFAICLPFAVPESKAEAKIIFDTSFENGTQGFKTHTDGCSKDRAFSTVSNPARQGKALKIALKDCDKRGELYLDGILRGGDERWIAWSLFVDKNYPADGRPALLQQQFTKEVRSGGRQGEKSKCGSEADSHKLLIENNQLNYYVFDNQDDKNLVCRRHPLQLKKGQWTDLVMNAKLDGSSSSFIKIWQDGKLVVNHRGNLGTSSNRFKLGQYQGSRENRTLYLDEVKIGDSNSSYEEVAPGGGRPPRPERPESPERPSDSADTLQVRATSEPQPENNVQNLIDGDPRTRWSALGFPQSFQVKLPSAQRIREVLIDPYEDRAYQIEVFDAEGERIGKADSDQGGKAIRIRLDSKKTDTLTFKINGCEGGNCSDKGDWVGIEEVLMKK